MKKRARRVLDYLLGRVAYRIFVPFFLIIILGVGIALPYGVRTTSRIMESHADAEAMAVASVVRNIIRKDLDKLLTFCQLKVYTLAIQEAINRCDITTLRQLILPVKARSRVDIVVIFDRNGDEIIRFDDRHLLGDDLRRLRIVRNGLNGMTYQDIVVTPTQLVMCAIAPNETSGVPGGMNGAMLVGQVVSDIFVAEIRETAGTDLAISNPGGLIVATTWRDREELSRNLAVRTAAPVGGSRSGEHLSTFFVKGIPYRVADVTYDVHQEPRAIISVIMDISGIYRTKRNVITVMIFLMVVGLVLSVVVSLRIARSISNPIEKLVKATESMAAGDLSQRVTDVPHDEIGRLSEAFNFMAQRIGSDIDEIQKARLKSQHYSEELEVINRELKKARSELIQASKMVAMGQLGAGIAHELNQPLLAIGLFAEQTLKYLPSGSSEAKNVERIISQTNRMSEIINEIRLFARQSLLEPREVDVNEPLRKALSLVERQLTDANITVVLDLDENVPRIMADDNQIQQVFLNLITNARDAILPKGKGTLSITSRAVVDRQFVYIDFSDDGVGIAPENINEIFLPFFTTKRETRGLGLGLSISYGIIQRHSGIISVRSLSGQGTLFRVLLPTVLARNCWEAVGCNNCRPGVEMESCPVYAKDLGYFCWGHFQQEGDGEKMRNVCLGCPLYQARHKVMSLGER